MSRLKITDLSFCKTDINDSEKVRGGASISESLAPHFSYYDDFYFPSANSGFKLAEKSLTKYGYKTSYFYDDATGDFAVVVSKAKGNGKAYSQASSSYAYKGKIASAKAFASV
ncbi:hypothetical protein Riv7116_0361 [Rivularia sp. PCC 7116]|uniref:hypothetical protein n=1 Tax=Rivularia sp. PCC 7116 TaxID=373994 RepID=UPI00029F4262|nr:hypothetical protein [Rivularia sp. PCC 7116]AFY52965.1 hypothetical protein Riv7116_0361 [Rivularia sp. PCC 7116]